MDIPIIISVTTPRDGVFDADAAVVNGCALKRSALLAEIRDMGTVLADARHLPDVALRVIYCALIAQIEADNAENLSVWLLIH